MQQQGQSDNVRPRHSKEDEPSAKASSMHRKTFHSINNASSPKYFLVIVLACLLFLLVFRRAQEEKSKTTTIISAPKNLYTLFAVADRDTYSYDEREKVWKSILVTGTLHREKTDTDPKFEIEWRNPVTVQGKLVEGKRGMELSELKFWNGKLYTVDDRTGGVFELHRDDLTAAKHFESVISPSSIEPIPRFILTDGDGERYAKGFKSEWATVKDGNLVVGSIGKEWTTGKGAFVNNNPFWIKQITPQGTITAINWEQNFKKVRELLGITFPGYMIHEAIEWSEIHRKWFILPRRVCHEIYDEDKDIFRGSNLLIIASEDFSSFELKRIGPDVPNNIRGYSSFKFIPGTNDNEVVAMKSAEDTDGTMKSYISVFRVSDSKVLFPETLVLNEKLEGLEII